MEEAGILEGRFAGRDRWMVYSKGARRAAVHRDGDAGLFIPRDYMVLCCLQDPRALVGSGTARPAMLPMKGLHPI